MKEKKEIGRSWYLKSAADWLDSALWAEKHFILYGGRWAYNMWQKNYNLYLKRLNQAYADDRGDNL